MRKLFAPLVAVFVLATPFLAHAADTTGAIKALDANQRTITLEDGKVYTYSGALNVSKFKVGDKIKIVFTPANAIWTSLGVTGFADTVAPAA